MLDKTFESKGAEFLWELLLRVVAISLDQYEKQNE